MRIVSLLPAATEIICALGLDKRLVGVTHECDYPAHVAALPKVTRTDIPPDATSGEIDRLVRDRVNTTSALYTLDLDVLRQLAPNLIVTQALCGVCAVAEDEVAAAACSLANTPDVVNLTPGTIWDVFDCVRHVANAAGVPERAGRVVQELSVRVDAVAQRNQARTAPTVAFLEWLDPPFSSGHWTPELIRLSGGRDLFGREGERSRTLSWDEVIASQPDVLVIACCGFGIERTLGEMHLVHSVGGWDDLPAVRNGRVYVLDGSQYFSRPGPRLVDGLELLAHVFHPDANPLPDGARPRYHRFVAGATRGGAVRIAVA